ncbi:LuxR C-terminal-related transcriptional regulator [bacterium]|nr:LuxR C-terminal-related transcriptional regulator [bacterium]
MTILATKLYIPPSRPKAVPRPRLIERLNEGLHRKLTLISATAGFGKTTLVSEWIAGCDRPAAWLSLDEGDADPKRFLTYLVVALRTISSTIGQGVVGVLQSPQTPSTESILTGLINEITTVPDNFILVLDDYHVIDAKPVDSALTFLIEHLPPQMHLVIITRENPDLPLARLRVRGQLTELRAIDLRFTSSETAGFLNQVMGLSLTTEDVAALETRTEGWIAGLQLAAISMRGHKDATGFIKSFTGSHHFVMDYLVEEVLRQQPENIQTFLLRTSILDRLCGPLCEAVLRDPSVAAQETLDYLEHANLFIIPLDNERRWYRYHHLFADLLRQRLHQKIAPSTEDEGLNVADLHLRAGQWCENNGLEIEAFHHAVAANDVEYAARLIEGKGMPLYFRGAVAPVLNWLKSLPETVLNAKPFLWTTFASVQLVSGQPTGVEKMLQAAETALRGVKLDDTTRDIIGRVASIRGTIAAGQFDAEAIISLSQRALEFLSPDNLSFRTFNIWKLGFAYDLQGDRVAAGQAFTEALSVSQASGNVITHLLATLGLAHLKQVDNQLHQAARTYQDILKLFGDKPLPFASQAYLGLAQIHYQWNDLKAAEQHGQQCLQLARQSENSDRLVVCKVFLSKLKLVLGDATGASTLLTEADQFAIQHNFTHLRSKITAVKVLILLHQGNLDEAAQLAQKHELSISQARVCMARGDISTALTKLESLLQQSIEKGWADERLKCIVLLAIAQRAHSKKEEAVRLLEEALSLAELGGFIRIFVDEGMPMAQLLSEADSHGIMPDYTAKLLAAFETKVQKSENNPHLPSAQLLQPLIEPLSQRELEVLRLIAQGLSNDEIRKRLFLALSTVKGHNRNIFGKLQVQRRTEAIARARELGLL